MLSKILSGFSKKKPPKEEAISATNLKTSKVKVTPTRIGEIGEYKINIQLDQLPKNSQHLSDIMLENPKSKTGFSQIDHIVITPFAIFVIETKNYTGTVYGDRNRAKWSINGKFPMMNPFNQNYGHIQAIKGVLETMGDTQFVSMVSFNKRCTFKVNEELRKIQSNGLIVYDTELSEFITRKINVLKLQLPTPLFSDEEILYIYNVLIENNITDLKIRKKHVDLLNEKAEIEDTDVAQAKKAICKICGKEISDKVKAFCLSNEKRFQGNVYCYQHQKKF